MDTWEGWAVQLGGVPVRSSSQMAGAMQSAL